MVDKNQFIGKKFIGDCCYQLHVFLSNRSIEYDVRHSNSTRSQYWIFTLDKEICVRISDHPPTTQTAQDYSIHPRGKYNMARLRTILEKRWMKSQTKPKVNTNMEITHIQIPPYTSLTGQACMAMLLGVPIDHVITKMKTYRHLTTADIAFFLRSHGLVVRTPLTHFHFKTKTPDICIVKGYTVDDLSLYWSLKVGNTLYDPRQPESQTWNDDFAKEAKKAKTNRITTYLKIQRSQA